MIKLLALLEPIVFIHAISKVNISYDCCFQVLRMLQKVFINNYCISKHAKGCIISLFLSMDLIRYSFCSYDINQLNNVKKG